MVLRGLKDRLLFVEYNVRHQNTVFTLLFIPVAEIFVLVFVLVLC